MTFNIADFTSKVREHGFAKKNIFSVTVELPYALTQELSQIPVTTDLRFFCKTITLPEIDITTADVQPQAFGPVVRRPQSLNFPILPTVFMVDEDYGVLKFFHRWAQHIVNFDKSSGNYSSVNNQLPFEMSYKNDYDTVMTVTSFTDEGKPAYVYKFSGLYPINVGSVDQSWEINDEALTLPVGFTYDQLEVTGARSGEVSADYPGPKSSDYMTVDPFFLSKEVKSFVTNQSIPQSIQDSINQFSSVNTDLFKGLKL
tara:strand:+ start:648 stop:1418 length:771 start_codon:yes stop_codon:yes gene_type:complete